MKRQAPAKAKAPPAKVPKAAATAPAKAKAAAKPANTKASADAAAKKLEEEAAAKKLAEEAAAKKLAEEAAAKKLAEEAAAKKLAEEAAAKKLAEEAAAAKRRAEEEAAKKKAEEEAAEKKRLEEEAAKKAAAAAGDRVELHGLQATDLNGAAGFVVEVLKTEEKVVVELDGGRRVRLKSGQVKVCLRGVAIGQKVELCGLKAADLNGAVGTVTETLREEVKVVVELESGRLLRVKAAQVRAAALTAAGG